LYILYFDCMCCRETMEVVQREVIALRDDLRGEERRGEALTATLASLTLSTQRLEQFETALTDLQSRLQSHESWTTTAFEDASASWRRGEERTAEEGRRGLQDMRAEVEARAFITSLEATDENVTCLQTSVDGLSRRVDVCLRFIEWFSDKGASYEYNAGALERHMNALAVGNRSRVGGEGSKTSEERRGEGRVAGMDDITAAAYKPFRPTGGSINTATAGAATGSVGAPGPVTGSIGVRIGGTHT
jgi:hypothetical protein